MVNHIFQVCKDIFIIIDNSPNIVYFRMVFLI